MDEELPLEEFPAEASEIGTTDVAALGAVFGGLFFFTMFGLLDIVFIILACATAYKVASQVGLGIDRVPQSGATGPEKK